MKKGDLFEKWLATRPESVQKLGREFPPGTYFRDEEGTNLYVVGYTEYDQVIASLVNPATDYDKAMLDENKLYAHAQCIRDSIRKS